MSRDPPGVETPGSGLRNPSLATVGEGWRGRYPASLTHPSKELDGYPRRIPTAAPLSGAAT